MPQNPSNNDYQYIKLPDGSYGKFRADASDEQIRNQIQKDFPSAFGKQSQSVGQWLAPRALEAGKGLAKAGVGIATAPYELLKGTTPEERQQYNIPQSEALGPITRVANRVVREPLQDAARATAARKQAAAQGEGLSGQILSSMENLPFGIGSMTRTAEQGAASPEKGQGLGTKANYLSPQSFGAAGEGTGYAVGGEALKPVAKAIGSKYFGEKFFNKIYDKIGNQAVDTPALTRLLDKVNGAIKESKKYLADEPSQLAKMKFRIEDALTGGEPLNFEELHKNKRGLNERAWGTKEQMAELTKGAKTAIGREIMGMAKATDRELGLQTDKNGLLSDWQKANDLYGTALRNEASARTGGRVAAGIGAYETARKMELPYPWMWGSAVGLGSHLMPGLDIGGLAGRLAGRAVGNVPIRGYKLAELGPTIGRAAGQTNPIQDQPMPNPLDKVRQLLQQRLMLNNNSDSQTPQQ